MPTFCRISMRNICFLLILSGVYMPCSWYYWVQIFTLYFCMVKCIVTRLIAMIHFAVSFHLWSMNVFGPVYLNWHTVMLYKCVVTCLFHDSHTQFHSHKDKKIISLVALDAYIMISLSRNQCGVMRWAEALVQWMEGEDRTWQRTLQSGQHIPQPSLQAGCNILSCWPLLQ